MDAGGIPRVKPPDTAKGAEFRAALKSARERFNARHARTIERKAQGYFVDGESYWAMRRDSEALQAAKNGKVHKLRMAALAKVCAS